MGTLSLSSDTLEKGIGSHYRWLWDTMWVLGIELRTSGRAVSALNYWAISAAPLLFLPLRETPALKYTNPQPDSLTVKIILMELSVRAGEITDSWCFLLAAACGQDCTGGVQKNSYCEARPVPGKYRSGCSQSAIGWSTGPPSGGARESTQGAKGVCNPIEGSTIWTNQYPLELCL
jgi:hypothetical protein